MKSRNFIARLLERAANRAAEPNALSTFEKSTSLPSASPIVAAPISPKPIIVSGLEDAKPVLVDQDPNEPPLICWKHKLYRQKVVDGGLEPYGPPVGDC